MFALNSNSVKHICWTREEFGVEEAEDVVPSEKGLKTKKGRL